MYSSVTSSPSTVTSTISLFSSSNQKILSNFRPFTPIHRCQGRRKLCVKSLHDKPRTPLRVPINAGPVRRLESNAREEAKDPSIYNYENMLRSGFSKSIAFTWFWVVLGLCTVRGFQAPAPVVAATQVASETIRETKDEVESEELSKKRHDYSDCTRILLEKVSGLIRTIDEVKSGNGDVKNVEAALKEVKLKKKELQGEIASGLEAELGALNEVKRALIKRSEKIVGEVKRAKIEEDDLLMEVGGGNERVKQRLAKLEAKMSAKEVEYNEIFERIDEIEDQIARREMMALSVAGAELSFIERECELLVKEFIQEVRRQTTDSVPKSSLSKLSKPDIAKELETARNQLLEQIILPNVLESDDIRNPRDQDLTGFAQRTKQVLKDSSEMQKNLEAGIRNHMKKFGDEKRFVVKTTEDEVVKGFPEMELKWMFGNKEVVVPKAVSLNLFHGWKKWREEVKADLKRHLLEDEELRKKYVAQRQECILLDRDRVAAKTWYNVENRRWEMDPVAVPYAVSQKLVEKARIRHDWAAMYMTLKGEDKEYFVDIKEFEMIFEDVGGFDGLYLRMVASGIPTAVQIMWIPFSELDFHQQVVLLRKLAYQCLSALWNNPTVSYLRKWASQEISHLHEDILVMIVFPVLEFLIPYPLRLKLGMAWPEYTNQSVGSTSYLKWQYDVEMTFNARKMDGFLWYVWFFVRSCIYGIILYIVCRVCASKIQWVQLLLGYRKRHRYPYIISKYRNRKRKSKRQFIKEWRKMREYYRDPISVAFAQMKRVKNPPIPLKDFTSVESVKEEINEVVAFLRNPKAFQEIGARPPRGVLIVGDKESEKTALALAIAAEAKVPVVKIRAYQLEADIWVGQSAGNVRELFKTARDLAPVIIFVEDFDIFAGVRGNFIHTEDLDHESFINQLLVELDGFEKQDGVVLMATASNVKQIDKALRRPGRMDRIFHLQRPTLGEREKILRNAAKETMDNDLIDFVDWEKVAVKTDLLRRTDLRFVPVALEGSAFRNKFLDSDELLSYCSWFATISGIVPRWVRKTKIVRMISKMLVNHLGLTLTKEDLQNVVDLMEPYGRISNGVELVNPPIDWTRETKFPHAVWAAGRGLAAFLLPDFDTVHNLWLEPLSWEGIGCTKITKKENEGSRIGNVQSRAYLEKKLVFCFGSYVASQLLLPFGDENFLSSSELNKAQEIATTMVLQYGWGLDDSPTIYRHGHPVGSLNMGNNYRNEMATKVEKLYYSAYDRANSMLQKNRRVLEKVVEELLEFDVLTVKDLERIFANNGGIQEKEPFSLSSVSNEEPVFGSILDNENASGIVLSSSTN